MIQTIPPGVMGLLRTLSWVHSLDLTVECTGCANDGEPEPCEVARPCVEQAEVQDGDGFAILCDCGHEIVWTSRCQCSGPAGWHCPGEDSQHWSKGDAIDGECGHCGWQPDEADVAEMTSRALTG